MFRTVGVIAALVFLGGATAGFAQPTVQISVVPEAPTTDESVTFILETNSTLGLADLTVTGNLFRFDVGGGIIGPPPFPLHQEFHVGRLPAGSYRYDVYIDGELDSSGVFAVTAVQQLPTVSNVGVLLLCMGLAALGAAVIGPRP